MINKATLKKCCLYLCIICIAIVLCMTAYKKVKYQLSIIKKYTIDYSGISNLEYSPDENDFCFVTNWDDIVGPTIVKNQYILDRKRSGYAIEEGYQYVLSVIKSYDVRVHDIHTGELLKTIDITQSLKHISDQWQLSRSGIGSIVLDGEPFVCIPMQRKPSKGEYDIDADFSKNNVGTLYVSIEDGRYFVKTYQEDKNYVFTRMESHTLSEYLSFLDANGYSYLDIAMDFLPNYDNLCQIQLPVSNLPSNNEKLYTMFPGLKNVPRDSENYVYIFLKDQPDDLSLLELIFEDNQEDYFEENLMMYGRFYKTEEEIKEYWQLAEDYINFKKNNTKVN